ncbi:uncharacterized protein Dana_GF28154, isoform B [Drosophila ananassae]|uniref:Uncharacterized protein, isoform B n=1 Tax=Drosophila ananassae TaxID=7217 RepID=A0A0P9BY62_DROAN|nr:uncharacterized protein LOC26515563 isoform X2 [Drosophila ananassae]KPU76386.1 uncharacterized protein Dana_GF28154, isoform B [Drosophila ananassae]
MWRLQKCCCFLGLRKGCILIAILDFFTNVLVLNFAETKFIGHIEQAVAICHCIGCLFLLGGALIPHELHHFERLLCHHLNLASKIRKINSYPKYRLCLLWSLLLDCGLFVSYPN